MTLFSITVDGAILGGDLENTDNDWDNIAQDYSYNRCNIFKIPHHGSSNGYSEKVWQNMLKEKPISIVTRFNPSSLPQERELKKLLEKSSSVYVLGGVKKKAKRLGTKYLKGTKRESNNEFISIDNAIGTIRISWENGKWVVETKGEVKVMNNNKEDSGNNKIKD